MYKIRLEKRVNEIVNRLNKTKEEAKVDFRAERERRDEEERNKAKNEMKERAQQEKEEKERRKKEASLRYGLHFFFFFTLAKTWESIFFFTLAETWESIFFFYFGRDMGKHIYIFFFFYFGRGIGKHFSFRLQLHGKY